MSPRLVGIGERVDRGMTIEEAARAEEVFDALNMASLKAKIHTAVSQLARGGVDITKLVRAKAKTTRQGVPDLNGPRLNGSGYNGHRSVNCVHHKNPQMVGTHVVEIAAVDGAGYPVTKKATHCSTCGDKLYDLDED